MKIPSFVFFGTDEFSLKVLQTLAERNLKPSILVTTPDKPQGRKNKMKSSLTKVWAQENKIEIIQPSSLKDPLFFEKLKNIPCDFFLVASYGKIIPKIILDIPPFGTLNIHPSLLPKYRGPSPLESVILNGEKETGVSLMIVDEEMDHGPILSSKKIPLQDNYTFERLRDELAILGAELLVETLPIHFAGNLKPKIQNHLEATYTKKLAKDDGLLDLKKPAIINYRKILALNPWPGVYFIDNHAGHEIRVAVKKATLKNDELIFERVLPEGRKEMNWVDYQRGRR